MRNCHCIWTFTFACILQPNPGLLSKTWRNIFCTGDLCRDWVSLCRLRHVSGYNLQGIVTIAFPALSAERGFCPMDLPCTHLPFLMVYLFSRQAVVPAPCAECSFPLSGEISLPYRQPALKSPSFLCPIININHNLADEKKFPVFVISCQSSPSFSQFGKTNVHCSMSWGLTKLVCFRPTRKMNSEHEVLLWPSGGAVGPPRRAMGQDNLSAHLPHCWADTDMGEGDAVEHSSPISMLSTASWPRTSARREGRACPHPLAHPWGQGEERCAKSGAGAVVVPLWQCCLCGKGLLLCQVRQSLYTSWMGSLGSFFFKQELFSRSSVILTRSP